MVSRTQQLRGVGPLSGAKLSGVVQNHKNIRRVGPLLEENPEAEFMYLRENEIRKFAPAKPLEKLRVLDLSMNQIGPKVSFLSLLPHIHHLYLSVNKIESLEGFSGLVGLETLCISDNAITSFAGLGNLPNLRVLSLNFNAIASFDQYPSLPNLHTLNLVGNRLTEYSSYRSMAIAINNHSLVSIDGKPVKEEERAAVDHYKGKIVYCIRSGYIVEEEDRGVEAAADEYMARNQRSRFTGGGESDNGMIRLNHIRVSPQSGPNANSHGSALMEGQPLQLSVCLQDVRPAEESVEHPFVSPNLFPAVFRFTPSHDGEEQSVKEVLLTGAMNGWAEPIEMVPVTKKDEETGEECISHYEATLYLPAGEYEYRYLVEGEIQLENEKEQHSSEFVEGSCHRHEVKEPAEDQKHIMEEVNTIFHIRWMRQSPGGLFELVEREHGVVYVPTRADIGCCLRCEVLAYVNGQFSFLFFDITAPITPAPPRCTRLEIKGKPQENQTLTVEADYFGGEEGSSSLAWSKITRSGEEVPITLQNPFGGFKVPKDCIGCTIKVTFTPVRSDWVPGEPVSATTAEPVEEGRPECESIKIIGNLMEHSRLAVEVVYTGGVEGISQYQWLRKGANNQYVAIEGETNTSYYTTLEDVGKSLAVEYTPVNDKGQEGEACRCVLDNLIAPAAPEIQNVSIYGQLKENEVLVLQYEYRGGLPGNHVIHWYRRTPGSKKPTRIGTGNANNLHLTARDVGATIEVTMTPVRSDGARGATVLAKTASLVTAGDPAVAYLNITGRPVVGDVVEAEVDFTGGEEGRSLIIWQTLTSPNEEEAEVVEVARGSLRYTIQRQDAGKILRVTYVPVRIDGLQGVPKSNQVFVE